MWKGRVGPLSGGRVGRGIDVEDCRAGEGKVSESQWIVGGIKRGEQYLQVL